MAVIHAPTSPCASCSVCGVQRQFHFASDVPRSADRDHEFVAMAVADFEPGDLDPKQLVLEIWARPNTPRAVSCGNELRSQVRERLGVDWDDLSEALT